MPQAPEQLRSKFPGMDREALDVIEANFTNTKGVIRKKDAAYQPSQREWDAVDYLFQEWDYEYTVSQC